MKTLLLIPLAASLLSIPLLADPPATKPATQPATATAPAPAAQPAIVRINRHAPGLFQNQGNILEAQRQNIRNQQQRLEGYPIVATFKPQELVRFSLSDGLLRAETGVADLQRGEHRVKVEGSDATWVINTNNTGLPGGSFINIARYDFDQLAEDQTWTVNLNMNDTYLMLTGNGVGFNIYYQQMNNTVMFNATQFKNGRYQPILQLNAPNLQRLQSDHPDEVRTYLLPLLKRFMSQNVLSPGAADVYTVFSELMPAPTVARQVNEILPKLDSELFTERDAASRQLADLGAAGILAALRIDRASLTEEQKGRLDAFIASERRRSLDDVSAMRHDLNFLLDCLENSDPAIRSAAKQSLETVVNHPLDFDIAADTNARTANLDQLRQSLRAEQGPKPATQPAPAPLPLRF